MVPSGATARMPCGTGPAIQLRGTGVRPGPRGGGPLAPDRDPAPDERRVSSRGDAQFGDLPVPAGVLPALAEAERRAGAFGQQVGTAGRGLLQFGDRRGFLLGGEPGLGVPGGGAGDLSVPETVRIRARHPGRIESVFYWGQGSRFTARVVTHVRRAAAPLECVHDGRGVAAGARR